MSLTVTYTRVEEVITVEARTGLGFGGCLALLSRQKRQNGWLSVLFFFSVYNIKKSRGQGKEWEEIICMCSIKKSILRKHQRST